MYLGDPNITKKGLLALKDSKPVPITAHSHEIVVPCIYTETVKRMMKAKGIELPLTPAKLAEARKLAKSMPGKYETDPSEKQGGTSHAKGTTNVTVNIKNIMPTRVRHAKRGRKGGRSKVVMARATGLIPAPPPVINPNYNLIRPFVANTPMGFEPRPAPSIEEMRKVIQHEDALEKRIMALEGVSKKAEERDRAEIQHVKEQIVRPDDFVDVHREEVITKKMRPSEVVIEQVDEPSPSVEQPAVPAPRVAIQHMERGPLLEKLRSYADLETSLMNGFDIKPMREMFHTIKGHNIHPKLKKAQVVEALAEAVRKA